MVFSLRYIATARPLAYLLYIRYSIILSYSYLNYYLFIEKFTKYGVNFYKVVATLWVAAKLNPQISPQRVPDILYQIFCFQQAFWLNIRHSMSPLKNIYIFRRIFLRQKLKNRAKIEKSVKIKNWQMNFFGFFFSFFG